jgi:hypothetical protein
MVTRHEKEEDFKYFFQSIKNLHKTLFNTEYEPTGLVADNAEAISNAFRATFSNANKRGNCWAHVIRNIDKQLRAVDAEHRAHIRKDILDIQLQTNEQRFFKAFDLFIEKWTGKKNTSIDVFLLYFKAWRLPGSNGWFEGYDLDLPSTSNAIESIHRYMKLGLMGSRLSLIQFLNNVSDPQVGLIAWWSFQRNPVTFVKDGLNQLIQQPNLNCKEYKSKPTISSTFLKEASEWNNKEIRIITVNSLFIMSTSSDKNKQVSTKSAIDYLKLLKDCSWTSFDEMIKSLTKYNLVKLDRNLWESSICSCYYWLKNRKCYHVVAAAYRVKLCNFSDICMDQLIEPNRKRGAPEKNKPALMIQPSDSNATRPKKDLLVEGALSEDEDEDDVPLVNLAKRRTAAIANTKSAASETTSTTQADKQQKKTALICKICGGAKIMNCRYGTCPNNCKK